jgi:putative redox protein
VVSADGAPAADEPVRQLQSGTHRLEWHLARPPSSAARDKTRSGLVIAHGLPLMPASAATAAQTFPELADRIAADTGWAALSFTFSGAGRSGGQFSPQGWLDDFVNAVAFLREEVPTVWLAGFGFGGTLALRVAALDPTIGGLAVLAAPSDLSAWVADPASLAAAAHEAGLVDDAAPDDLGAWSAALRMIDPLGSAAAIRPRPLLIVHGTADEEVPLVDARALADAAETDAELRVVAEAGHGLRHDPRVVASLLGWLERRAG